MLIAILRPCLFRREKKTKTRANRCLPPPASTMAETRQLEAAYSREYQSHSAPIEQVGACNKQSTKARGHLAMQNEIMIQGEEGEQNRTGGGAGQHTTQTSKTLPKNSIKIYRVKGSGRTKLTIIHRLQVRRLRLQPRQHHRQRDAKGRSEIGRDGAWVRREQSRCSRDPPAHFREAPIRRYSGCPQPFPSSALSPNAHAMLLGRKSPTAAPHWKDRST